MDLSVLGPQERLIIEQLWKSLGEFQFTVENNNTVEIDLSNWKLSIFPSELSALSNLTRLWLNGNRLTAVPPELGQLTALTELRLDGNQLTAVPPELGQLTALTELRLDGNQLTAVPPELAHLTALMRLALFDNPLSDPYVALSRRNPHALLAYLRSLSDPEQVVTLRESRLILVGNGGVGKTQLKNALLGHPYDGAASTTHGIEIERLPLHLPSADDGDMTLSIWDFGGQETYEVTHQFFYSERAVYLLVWHPRAADVDQSVEPWLRRLRFRLGDNARVVIVATHKNTDSRPIDLDLTGLRQKFGNIVLGFYPVENSSWDGMKNGIPELKQALATAANDLSLMGMKINRAWLAVREEISQFSTTFPHISRTRFDEIASRHGLTSDEAEVWLELLHDLGDVLYYSRVDGLRDFVVLRPDWLLTAIARILDDHEVLAKHGILDHSRFPELWKEYDPALHPFLHSVMEQFDICCREKGQDWSLVGEKVPYARPLDLQRPTGTQLRMVYEFEDEPPGLMPWLIVRNYRFTTGQHWRLGIHLSHEGHDALLEFDRGTRHLSLTVHGPVPVYFFVLLQDGIEQVLPRWAGLEDRVRRLVPCGQNRRDGSTCDRYFNLLDLRDAAAHGEQLQCHGCRKMADLAQLLTGGVQQEHLFDLKTRSPEENLVSLQQLFQYSQRTLLRAMGTGSRQAPRLFSIWPKLADGMLARTWQWMTGPGPLDSLTYEVWLWCEHVEKPHPVKRYEISVTAEWLRKVAPYAKLIATTLKAGLPFLIAELGLYLDRIGASEDKKEIADRIDRMNKLAEQSSSADLGTRFNSARIPGELTVPEAAGLREFHALLAMIDPASHWGDLRPTMTKEGDYLWLCPEHHREFDPGLITIPSPSR